MNEPDRLAEILRDTVVGMVRQDAVNMTARQLAVLLVCCLDKPPHIGTVLARDLSISKPAISRIVDTLVRAAFLERRKDMPDRRVAGLTATLSGHDFVAELGAMMQAAAKSQAAEPPR